MKNQMHLYFHLRFASIWHFLWKIQRNTRKYITFNRILNVSTICDELANGDVAMVEITFDTLGMPIESTAINSLLSPTTR